MDTTKDNTPISNMEKYHNYKRLFAQLKKAISNECYYEAIFIEYAILEDRTESVLIHLGISTYEKNSTKKFNITKKLNLIKSREEFVQNKFIRKRLTKELVDQAIEWKDKRNELIHELPNLEYNPEGLKDIALIGYEIVKTFSNKVTSVNRHIELLQSKTVAIQ